MGFEDIEEIYLKSTDVLQKFRRDISIGDFKWYRFRNAKQILFHQSISRNSRLTSYIRERESDLGKESFPPLKRFTGKKIARSANYSLKSTSNLIATLSIL